MKFIVCFAKAIIFIIAYSSCTRFSLNEVGSDVQVVEKVIENLKEVQPPYKPNENSAQPYLEQNIILESLTKRIELLTIV